MARVHEIGRSNKSPGKCGRCNQTIPKGAGYRYAQPGFRSSRKLIRCMQPGCRFRPSELTTGKMSQVYAATESAEDMILGWDGEDAEDIKAAMTDCAEAVRAVSEEYAEAAEAMGSAGEEMQEKADELGSWADDIDSAADNLPEKPGDDEDEELLDKDEKKEKREHEAEFTGKTPKEDDSEKTDKEKSEALDDWRNEVREEASEAVGNCPV